MSTPQTLTSLVEAIQQIQTPIVKEADIVPEKPASEFQDLMDQLQTSFLKYFPNGYFRIQHSKRFGNSIIISLGLIKDQKDVSSNIRENDPMFTNIFLHYNEATGIFEVGSSSSGLSINPEEGSYMAMGTVKNPVRKFKTDNQAVIVKKLDQYFAKYKEIVKANWDNIYGVDRIDPKYMVEGNISEQLSLGDEVFNKLIHEAGWDEDDNLAVSGDRILRKEYNGQEFFLTLDKTVTDEPKRYIVISDGNKEVGDVDINILKTGLKNRPINGIGIINKSINRVINSYLGDNGIQESSGKSVNISGQDLLQASATVSKYPNDIRIKATGKNKFTLSLSNSKLLDTDKTLASLFKSLKESMNIVEDGEEVFSNDTGKVIASIKDGKKIFTAYNDEGNIVGKPYLSKTIAVTALAIAKSKSTQPVQEAEMATIEVPATGSEFFRLLDKIPGDFSEDNPLKLGNTEFWKDKLGVYAGQWAYYPSTNKWDNQSITNDLLRILQTNKGNE